MKKQIKSSIAVQKIKVGRSRDLKDIGLHQIPHISLKGQWLADSGFRPGQYVSVITGLHRIIICLEGEQPLLESWIDADAFVRIPGGQILRLLPPLLDEEPS
ncbi:hypothetical protein DBR32_00070 [Taibaiella sp. KBW10]|nr:hypothetical protein DBR32_00070 [Taibaiella sp. KBW10]